MFLATRPDSTATRLPAWHGLGPAEVAVLVRTYTRPGNLIVDLDAHPTITAAAWYLGRVPTTLDDTGGTARLRPLPAPPDQPGTEPTAHRTDESAALVLATLPHPDLNPGDHAAVVATLCRWRALLRPGGYLIAVPVSPAYQGNISHRASIIAAAHEAGLRWQQHLLIVTGLPSHEPRTEPTPATIPTRLLSGRHIAAHLTALVFSTIEPEAADA